MRRHGLTQRPKPRSMAQTKTVGLFAIASPKSDKNPNIWRRILSTFWRAFSASCFAVPTPYSPHAESGAASLQFFNVTRTPAVVEKRFSRAIEPQRYEEAFVRNGS